jgi:hypothetical protein
MTGETPPAAKGVTEAISHFKATTVWALKRWKNQFDAEEMARVIFDSPAFEDLTAALSLPAPGEATPTELINRLQDAIEGECEGLAIDEDQAKAILEHVGYPSTPAAPELGDGWVMVPKEPNEHQLRQLFSMNSGLPRTTEEAVFVYHAILNCASPQQGDGQ